MTALQRVRASLAAGERPSDDDVRAVCADAERYEWIIAQQDLSYADLCSEAEYAWAIINLSGHSRREIDAAIDAAIREPK